MYTKGIRKILIVDNKHYGHIRHLETMATQTGHEAIAHNGIIWIKINNQWEESIFNIDDFQM